MEIAVIQNDGSRSIGLSECDVIIEDEFECWVSDEVALHLYASIDRWVDDISRRVEKYVDLLIDIDEYLVLIGLAVDRHAGSGGVDGVGSEQWEAS